MKPVTGNNIPETLANQSILSIQHALDGLSFCVSRFGSPLWLHREETLDLFDLQTRLQPLQYSYPRIRVIVDTDRVCLIPESLFSENAASEFMRINGMAPRKDTVLRMLRKEGFVILMETAEEWTARLNERFPESRIEYLHPLWFGIRRSCKASALDVNLSAQWVHIAFATSETLQYAETLPMQTPADLLYIFSELQKRFDLNHTDLIFSGRQAELFRKTISSYYKRTKLDIPVASKQFRTIDQPWFANLIRAAYENY